MDALRGGPQIAPSPRGTADERLRGILNETTREIAEVRALVVGDGNGLPIASAGRQLNRLASTAMATLAMTAASKVTSSLDLDPPDDIIIEAGAWIVIIRSLGEGFTLSAVVPEDTNLGYVRMVLNARALEIRNVLDEFR